MLTNFESDKCFLFISGNAVKIVEGKVNNLGQILNQRTFKKNLHKMLNNKIYAQQVSYEA